MNYIIGQSLGFVSTACAIVRPFCKKKWQIMALNAMINLLVAGSYTLIGKPGSAAMLCLVAVVQSVVSVLHNTRGTKSSPWEIVIFGLLYLFFGFLGLFTAPGFVPGVNRQNLLELMPIVGTLAMMAAIYAPTEQATRKLLLVNGCIWATYAFLQGSSTCLTNLVSTSASAIALYRYRRKTPTT